MDGSCKQYFLKEGIELNTKKRIIGLDFARALAMFGMLLINFMVITGAEGNGPPIFNNFNVTFLKVELLPCLLYLLELEYL